VAAVCSCLAQAGANIIQSDQYSTDPEAGRFFMRLEFQLGSVGLDRLTARFRPIAERFGCSATNTT
jgi:formyltetrahydrofolate deformylase